MSVDSCQTNHTAKNVIRTFCIHGFQKTSMQEIADASGVSRQAIYKRFGSKKSCYEWIINTHLEQMYSRIFHEFVESNTPARATLIKVFDIFIGEAIEIIRNDHGAEVLNDILKATHASKEDWPIRFRGKLADYLNKHSFASTDNAYATAYMLISAAKGLLLEEASRTHFLEHITLMIDCIDQNQSR